MGGVFISYRREDSGATARALYERLAARLGQQNFFIDLDKLAPGVRYRQVLDERLQSCDALLAVIGKSWLTVADASGRRRLDDPDDILRREIASALQRDIVVIPVLVGDAAMPNREQLPADIAGLADCENVEMPDRCFDMAADKLIVEIRKVLEAGKGTGAKWRILRRITVGLLVAVVIVGGSLINAALLSRLKFEGTQMTAASTPEPVASPLTTPGALLVTRKPVAPANASGGGVLGDLIGQAESAGRGYGAYNHETADDETWQLIDFSAESMGTIMALRYPHRGQPRISNVGKYQLLPSNVTAAVESLHIPTDAKFTPALQETIFRNYMLAVRRPQIKAYITGQSADLAAAQLALAIDFAAVADPASGGSHYSGRTVLVSVAQTAEALNAEREAYKSNLAKGLGPDAAWEALSPGIGK